MHEHVANLLENFLKQRRGKRSQKYKIKIPDQGARLTHPHFLRQWVTHSHCPRPELLEGPGPALPLFLSCLSTSHAEIQTAP